MSYQLLGTRSKGKGISNTFGADPPLHNEKDAEQRSNDLLVLKSRQRILIVITVVTVIILLITNFANVYLLKELKDMKAELTTFKEHSEHYDYAEIGDVVDRPVRELSRKERAVMDNLSSTINLNRNATTDDSVSNLLSADIDTFRDSILKQAALIKRLDKKLQHLNATFTEHDQDLKETDEIIDKGFSLRIAVFDALLNGRFDELQQELQDDIVRIMAQTKQALLNRTQEFDRKIQISNASWTDMFGELQGVLLEKIHNLQISERDLGEGMNMELDLLNSTLNTMSRADIENVKNLNLEMMALEQKFVKKMEDLNSTFSDTVTNLQKAERNDIERLDRHVRSIENNLYEKFQYLGATFDEKTNKLQQVDKELSDEFDTGLTSLYDSLNENVLEVNDTLNEKVKQMGSSERQDVRRVQVTIGELGFKLNGKVDELQLEVQDQKNNVKAGIMGIDQNQTRALEYEIQAHDAKWIRKLRRLKSNFSEKIQELKQIIVAQIDEITRMTLAQQNQTEELKTNVAGLHNTLEEKVFEFDSIFNNKIQTLQQTFQIQNEEMNIKLQRVKSNLGENVQNLNSTFKDELSALQKNDRELAKDMDEKIQSLADILNGDILQMKTRINLLFEALKNSRPQNVSASTYVDLFHDILDNMVGEINDTLYDEVLEKQQVEQKRNEEFFASIIQAWHNKSASVDTKIQQLEKTDQLLRKMVTVNAEQMKQVGANETKTSKALLNQIRQKEQQETINFSKEFKTFEWNLKKALREKIETLEEVDQQLNHSLSTKIVESIRRGLNVLDGRIRIRQNEKEQQNTSMNAKIKEELQNQKNALDAVVQDFQDEIRDQISPRIRHLGENASASNLKFEKEIDALDEKVRALGELTRKLIQIIFDQTLISYAIKDNTSAKSSRPRMVRLIGGDGSYGMVELRHDGDWGAVHSDRWHRKYGNIVCELLGYSRASSVYSIEARWWRRRRIWSIDDQCDDREFWIEKCIRSCWGRHSCYNHRYASVRCE